ncbi:MAG: CorA family divalent cation transporter [Xanthobacteraceae bacterium]
MLSAFPDTTDNNSLAQASWIDVVDPTPGEIAAFEKAFELRVPTKEELGEIETTSRLRVDHGVLYMTAPLIIATGDEPWIAAPTGFVLSKKVLLTVRFVQSTIFDSVSKELNVERLEPASAYVCVLEELVDHMADLLEASSQALDDASHVIFRRDNLRRLSRETSLLRQLLVRTGRTSERMARVNYTLVCLDRMAKFTIERGREWVAQDQISRLQSVSADIASLEQYAEGLVNRIQLLQDAATGIINVAQNEVMKILTVASVAGIPPVLIAGIYGMNFKNMPELNWAWGYPFALVLIVLTTLLPLIWFKWKDWI